MADMEKVIAQLESMRDYHRSVGNNITADIANDAIAMLKEQEPKRGKWVKQLPSCPSAIAAGGSRTSICTACGGWGRKAFKYCPHCGAKMDGETE